MCELGAVRSEIRLGRVCLATGGRLVLRPPGWPQHG